MCERISSPPAHGRNPCGRASRTLDLEEQSRNRAEIGQASP